MTDYHMGIIVGAGIAWFVTSIATTLIMGILFTKSEETARKELERLKREREFMKDWGRWSR